MTKEKVQKVFDALSGKKEMDVFFEDAENFIKQYKEQNNGR